LLPPSTEIDGPSFSVPGDELSGEIQDESFRIGIPLTITRHLGTPTPVPEASTWAMMLFGFAGLALAGYRRAKAGPAALAR
jgi:hypothetical protein